MAAVIALGANGVQIGSRFVATKESSAHANFKNAIINSREGDTKLLLKRLTPVRLLKNNFFDQVSELEERGATVDELSNLLGKGRAKRGMYEGDLIEGELEIGQVSSQIKNILTAKEVVDELVSDYNKTIELLGNYMI
jgi:enoyl-[acyl-carrier protein] reductase II